MFVLMYCSHLNSWVAARNPVRMKVAHRLTEVGEVISAAENNARAGLFVVLFISYEAAPVFDRAFEVKQVEPVFPLAGYASFSDFQPVNFQKASGPGYSLEVKGMDISREVYLKRVQQIRELIAEGEVYQVNLTGRIYGNIHGDPAELFQDMVWAQGRTFGAYIDTGRFVICSASPELFLSLDEDTVITRPMKGTAKRKGNIEDDESAFIRLRQSQKDRAENAMVADMARNDLGRIARAGSVRVTSAFDVEKYRTVYQMTTTIRAELQPDVKLFDIFKATFPPASVTGTPKVSAVRLISRLEESQRKIYTGTIGYLLPGKERRGVFNVAIRTVLVDNEENMFEYGTGGGITYRSDPEDEYRELEAKARIITFKFPDLRIVETIRYDAARGYFLLDRHANRIKRSAEYFQFPLDIEEFRLLLEKAAGEMREGIWRVRILLDKTGGLEVRKAKVNLRELRKRAVVCLKERNTRDDDPFIFHKTTWRPWQEDRAGCDEILFVNQRGEITETDIANLFFIEDGRIYTPPVACGLLPGVFREYLIERGVVTEKKLPVERLGRVRLLAGNSLRGMYRIELTGKV